MRASQRWLFPHPRPLVERFGENFFRELPERPAVYLMCGAREGVLYVGKAKNLRKRLGSYRVANPEKFSRRILRLLHRVTRIEWDECPDDSAACYREELLIAVLQPRFNRAGKVWPLERGNIQHSTLLQPCSRPNLARYCLGDTPVAFLNADHRLLALR